MDVILYRYSCPRWYGTVKGIRNISIENKEDSQELINNLENLENTYSGSKTCKIDLLQKYRLSITNVENYSGITTIPVKIKTNSIICD
jgi:hypothetical protein